MAGPDSTQEESEVQMYLLALKNALLPDAVPLLTKYAESEVGAFSTIAITALQRYDTALITEEVNTGKLSHTHSFFKTNTFTNTLKHCHSTGEESFKPRVPSEPAHL